MHRSRPTSKIFSFQACAQSSICMEAQELHHDALDGERAPLPAEHMRGQEWVPYAHTGAVFKEIARSITYTSIIMTSPSVRSVLRGSVLTAESETSEDTERRRLGSNLENPSTSVDAKSSRLDAGTDGRASSANVRRSGGREKSTISPPPRSPPPREARGLTPRGVGPHRLGRRPRRGFTPRGVGPHALGRRPGPGRHREVAVSPGPLPPRVYRVDHINCIAPRVVLLAG